MYSAPMDIIRKITYLLPNFNSAIALSCTAKKYINLLAEYVRSRDVIFARDFPIVNNYRDGIIHGIIVGVIVKIESVHSQKTRIACAILRNMRYGSTKEYLKIWNNTKYVFNIHARDYLGACVQMTIYTDWKDSKLYHIILNFNRRVMQARDLSCMRYEFKTTYDDVELVSNPITPNVSERIYLHRMCGLIKQVILRSKLIALLPNVKEIFKYISKTVFARKIHCTELDHYCARLAKS